MSTLIRAHFDGRVIVPDEPVDLPVNTPLNFRLVPVARLPKDADIEERRRRLAKVTGFLTHPVPSDDALRRENMYEE